MWLGQSTTNGFPNCSFNSQFVFNQSAKMGDAPFDLYMDQNGVTPDGLQVERQSTTLLAMIAAGYNGAQKAAIQTATNTAALSGLYMMGTDGSNASGGRVDNHLWVDAGRQLTNEIMAQQVGVSDSFRAGQFQHGAMMNYNQYSKYSLPSAQCCSGSLFFSMKNHFDVTLGIGTQFAGAGDFGYNTQFMYFLALAYLNRINSAITEQPAPFEIGGYAFATNSDFGPQVVMNAGGTNIQLAMTGSTSLTTFDHPTLWTAMGGERIGRVGWEDRLGPNAGVYTSGLGTQVSFGPTWITSGTTWTRLAMNPSSCSGNFTTTFANPAVVFGKVIWTCTGSPAPTFTENLTVTPDGILSQTTCSGCPSSFGHTFPILVNDGTTSPSSWGATTTTTSIPTGTSSTGLVTTQWSNNDQQAYMIISSNPKTIATESNQTGTPGTVTPVRAYAPADITQNVFIYPRNSTDPSASSVQSGMTVTGTNTYTNSALSSSVVSGSGGTYYIGRTAAGGWTNSIAISGQTTTFNVPCNFIMTLSSGKIVSIETDRNVSVTIPSGGSNSGTAHTNMNVLAYTPVGNL
jgi:hypothetical protein